jgi:hypothetical protein
MKKLIIAIVIVAGFSIACEKVIEIPLNDANVEVVVEAVGRSFVGESYVLLSNSGSVYNDNDFLTISDALVTVTDKDGVAYVFTEDPEVKGKYINPTFQVLPNNSYSLLVDTGEKVLKSVSSSYSLPVLDSLNYIEQTGGGFGGGDPTDTSYFVFYSFKDNGDEENFYRARIWVNGKRDDNIYITNDKLFNGTTFTSPFFGTLVEKDSVKLDGMTDSVWMAHVYVELLSMDKAAYDYFFSLSSTLTTGPFSATPANPVSNIDNGIGYFSAFTVDTLTLKIQ